MSKMIYKQKHLQQYHDFIYSTNCAAAAAIVLVVIIIHFELFNKGNKFAF